MSLLVVEIREGVVFNAWECSNKRKQEAAFIDVCDSNGVPAAPIDVDNQLKFLKHGEGSICMVESRSIG